MGSVPLTKTQERSLAKWPCDGKPRFTVKGRAERLSYGETYDAILKQCGGSSATTKEGMRRVKALNRLYLMCAKSFIDVALWRMEQKIKNQPVGAAGQREGT